jgi:hypothetical protein
MLLTVRWTLRWKKFSVNEKITNKKKKQLTEIEISPDWPKTGIRGIQKKNGVCWIKVNLNSGLGNIHITDNNMEITSPWFYLLFPYFIPV